MIRGEFEAGVPRDEEENCGRKRDCRPYRFQAGVPGEPGRDGKDGVSPLIKCETVDGPERCIVVEDDAGHRWCFLPGAGAEGDVVIEDDNGNQWHMPAGEAESGEIAAQDEGGGAWHLPVGSDGSGYRITITDKNGEHVAYVWDGERGADGRQGVDGQPGRDGQDGADGFSPLVNMTEITGGYRLTITDKNGAHSVNIYNGEESVIFVATYGTTTQEELDAAYSAGKIIFVKKDGLCRLLTSTSLYQPTPTAEGIRNYTFALYRPDIKQVETVFWLADGRGWTAATASADWQSKITASGILKGDGAGGVTAATAGTDYATPALVKVSSTQPTEAENKLWVDTDAGSGNSYQIPTVAEMEAADAKIASELGIVVNGNATALGASEGQYIILRNSTIAGCANGLYTAAQAIPANTAIDATYLSGPISGGGLNSVPKWNYAVSTVVRGVSVPAGDFTDVVLTDIDLPSSFNFVAHGDFGAGCVLRNSWIENGKIKITIANYLPSSLIVPDWADIKVLYQAT